MSERIHIDTRGLEYGSKLWYDEQWHRVVRVGPDWVDLVRCDAPRVPRVQPAPARLPLHPQAPAARPVRARLALLLGRYGWELAVLAALAVVVGLPSFVRYF